MGLGMYLVAAIGVVRADEPKVLNWVYGCETGGSFGAQFVVGGQQAKLWLPGQPAIDLTQMMSGSGARYGGKTFELFIKGNDAFLEKGGAKVADNCRALEPRSVPASESETFTEAYAGTALQLRVGQTVHFKLPIQTGTGFSWQALPNGPDLQIQLGSVSAVSAPGAPATQPIAVKGKRPGFLVLEFQYARSWEKGTPPAKTVRFPILITD